MRAFVQEILQGSSWQNLAKTRYVNDKQITDHYAIIPTGQGMSALNSLSWRSKAVYDVIVKRFLSILYPAAVYQKVAITTKVKEESFFASFKVLAEPGYLKVVGVPGEKKGESGSAAGAEDRNVSGNVTSSEASDDVQNNNGESNEDMASSRAFFEKIQSLKKGMTLPIQGMEIKRRKDITAEAL